MMMMMMMMMMMIIIIILQRYKDKLAAALQKSTAYCKSAPSIVLAASKSSAGLIFGHCLAASKESFLLFWSARYYMSIPLRAG
jgi:hypothetical protein